MQFSQVYTAVEMFCILLLLVGYLPRFLIYLLFLIDRHNLQRAHLYFQVRRFTFFLFTIMAVCVLVLLFVYSAILSNTVGTGVAYVMVIFMGPFVALLSVDLYLTVMVKYFRSEKAFKMQPFLNKGKHKKNRVMPLNGVIADNSSDSLSGKSKSESSLKSTGSTTASKRREVVKKHTNIN